MVEAQTRMETPTLIALMIMAALVGYGIDQLLSLVNRSLTRWQYARE
ncbi:MAG: nitrate ABC transporter substrate-binding protein [Syntrophobacteraceae bacterium]|nr:nitrate ABC transporter substrate-binding protein [Syntrophobacteraceae bacterium]